MKSILKIILLLLIPVFINAQSSVSDSLRQALQKAPNDSTRDLVYDKLLSYYLFNNLDSALYFADKMVLISQKNNQKLAEAGALNFKGLVLTRLGQYASALQCFLQSFTITEDPKSENTTWDLPNNSNPRKHRMDVLALTHSMFAILQQQVDNTTQAIMHFKEAKLIGEKIGNPTRVLRADQMLGDIYRNLNKLDSAMTFEINAEHISVQSGIKGFLSEILSVKGDIYFKKRDKKSAKQFYYEGLQSAKEQNNLVGLVQNYFGLTKCYLSENNKDSSLLYAEKAVRSLKDFGALSGREYNIGTAYENLYHSYQLSNQFDSAFKYLRLALVTKDSLYKKRIKSLAEFQNLSFQEQLRLQELEKERAVFQYRARTYAMLGGLGVVLLIALILYRNNRQKQKANLVLERTLNNLKTTQSQLIQSEKMASLGELTAGIAHEIQNPLNFVNNFSEVNKELLIELKDEIEKGNYGEVKAIAKDVIENEQKINNHGKRSDAIVKGMLQHSRASTGKKELTDINALADEYLRLSYHGLRAKDKSFEANFKTYFDNSIGKINIIPQDIGRVLLNLYNNAFYAVNEKKRNLNNEYEPTVTVSTSRSLSLPTGQAGLGEGRGEVRIRVKDNGNGIPQKVLNKIFQPFFTTKPTGQGTGLGLSLSYDIVKAHGGEIKVESKEGEGAEFIIILPHVV